MEKVEFKYSKETIDEIVAIYGTSSHVYKYAKEGNTWAERMVAENAEYRCNINLGFEKILEVINTKPQFLVHDTLWVLIRHQSFKLAVTKRKEQSL